MEKRLDKINEDISIYQYTEGFLYGTDAVLLAAYVKPKKGAVMVELGTGTGIIPILIAHRKQPSRIFAFEIQEDYARLAAENVELCGMSDRIEIVHDDLKNITPYYFRDKGVESVDAVFTNPPYMKMTSGYLNESERKLTARHELKCNIDDICISAAKILKNGGDFFIIYRPDRLCDLFCAMRGAGIEPKEMTEVVSHVGEAPTLILVRGKKSALPSMKITKPFVIYDGKEYSKEMTEVYEKGSM
ncbi:MAG: tRNA1(Val) (adenine(37)-N6)-methyltransferase [Ruminococcaceae bacterium]|nr:tRNA1(Val) (adenine(37)-N6)-methyltransferase [Oscillospiraceae bacterium]